MKPLVSIIVTCYNYGNFITECLNSVQQQSFENFEVIVVDDGSTDNSEIYINNFLKDKRFKYIKQKNQGQAFAKNRGIKESMSQYIAFLDADDVWESEKLIEQLPLFKSENIGIVFSKSRHINKNSKFLPHSNTNYYLQPRRGDVLNYLIYDNFIYFSSAVIKKDCFNEFGLFDTSLLMGIDWDFWLRCATKFHFDFHEDFLLRYRTGHSGQMSNNLLTRIQCADQIKLKFKNSFPSAIPFDIIKEADYYSYCLRAYTLRRYGLKYTIQYLSRAIKLYPFRIKAYLRLTKTIFYLLSGK